MIAKRTLAIGALLLACSARLVAGELKPSPVTALITYGFPVMPPDQQTAVFSLTAKILRQDLTWAPDRVMMANGDFVARPDPTGGLTPEMRRIAQENPILAPLLREYERNGVKPSDPDILGLNVTEIRVLHEYWKCFDTEPTRDFVAKVADNGNVDEIIDRLALELPAGKPLRDFKVTYFLEVLTEHDGSKSQVLALVAAQSLGEVGRANLSDEEKKFVRLRPGVFGSIDETKIRARRAARAKVEPVTAERDRLVRYRQMLREQEAFFEAQKELAVRQKQDMQSNIGLMSPQEQDRLVILAKKLDHALTHPGIGSLTQTDIRDMQLHPGIYGDRLGQLAKQRVEEAARQNPAEQAAAARLKIAKSYLADNNVEKAKKKLRELIAEFPASAATSQAKKLLEKLGE